jgi:hypothetical protein
MCCLKYVLEGIYQKLINSYFQTLPRPESGEKGRTLGKGYGIKWGGAIGNNLGGEEACEMHWEPEEHHLEYMGTD